MRRVKMKDFRATHMFGGPCPRCGADMIASNAQTGLARCEAVRVSPVIIASREYFMQAPVYGKIETPCGWYGKVKFK